MLSSWTVAEVILCLMTESEEFFHEHLLARLTLVMHRIICREILHIHGFNGIQ